MTSLCKCTNSKCKPSQASILNMDLELELSDKENKKEDTNNTQLTETFQRILEQCTSHIRETTQLALQSLAKSSRAEKDQEKLVEVMLVFIMILLYGVFLG